MKTPDRFSRKQLHKIYGIWERTARPILGLTFNEYLDGTDSIQPIPQPNPAEANRLERQVFVDGRLIERVGLTGFCRLVKITHVGADDRYVPRNTEKAASGVRWIQLNDGRENRGHAPVDYLPNPPHDHDWLDVYEGIFTYLDDPRKFSDYSIYLLNSLLRGHPDMVGWIGNIFGYQPKLSWYFEHRTNPDFGAASKHKR